MSITQHTLDMLVQRSFNLIGLVPHDRNWHFSFVLRKNRVQSFGWNMPTKTHPLAHKFGSKFPYIHSELAAIKNFPAVPIELERCIMVNVRINRHLRVAMSKPCPCCQRILMAFGLKEVFFSSNDGKFEALYE